MLSHLIRSPHIFEVLIGYGGVHIISVFLLFYQFSITSFQDIFLWYLYGLALGGCLYTFIEYWFHRYLLHVSILKKAHDNHHKDPTKLKIIATPLLPVQIYEILIMLLLYALFGSFIANLFQIGISVSQIIMDYVHYFEHSSYRPWFLETARNYHKLHHRKSNHDIGFGLTCPFWDLCFGTLPDNSCTKINAIPWKPFVEKPWLRYLCLPFPMVTYLLQTPFISASDEISSYLKRPTLTELKFDKMLIAALSAVVVGLAPVGWFIL